MNHPSRFQKPRTPTAVSTDAPAHLQARRHPWEPYVLFVSYPLFWFLGFPWAWGAVATLPMLFALLRNLRHVRHPPLFGFWALFLGWTLVSATRLVGGANDRIIAFGYREIQYYAATVVLLYFYNSSPRITFASLAKAIAGLFVAVVVFGAAGLALPGKSFPTLASKILPASLLSVGLVHDMTFPVFSQYQNILGFTVPRPAAPYPYDNPWAMNLALTAPFAILALGVLPRRWRTLLFGALVFAIVPFTIAVSRGAWIALIVGLVYAAFRVALKRGHVGTVLKLAAVFALVTVLIVGSPLGGIIVARIQHPHSDVGRLQGDEEALQRIIESPILGYGAPLPSSQGDLSHNVGTHGQIWSVLFSFGVPGLAFFMGWFVSAFWRWRRGRTSAQLWAHVLILMAILMMPFYETLGTELCIVMAIMAFAYRDGLYPQTPPSRRRPADASLRLETVG
jgi:O-antigen ligase